MIEISVFSYSGRQPSDSVSALFGADGGTIGRGDGNTLTLVDPERHLSRIQARFTDLGNGRFHIANVSHANSIFVGDTEVEPQQQATGAVGITLRMGMYVLRTNRSEGRDAPAPRAFSENTNASAAPPAPLAASRTAASPNSLNSAPQTDVSSVPDPFADLLGSSKNAQDVSALFASTPPVSSRALPPLNSTFGAAASASSVGKIPDDFDPFSLPSAAQRNTDNPLRDLAETGADVSLRNVFEDVTPVNGLINSPDHATSRDSPSTLFGDASSSLNDSVATDPLMLFGGGGTAHSSHANPLAEFAMQNHSSELSASFALPEAVFEDKKAVHVEPIAANAQSKPLPAQAMFDPLAPHSMSTAAPADDVLGGLLATSLPTTDTDPDASRTQVFPSAPAPAFASVEPVRSRAKSAAAKNVVAASAATADASPRSTAGATASPNAATAAPKRTRRAASESTTAQSSLVAAFLEGAGVPNLDIPDLSDEELMRRVGAMLRASIDGTVDLMSARAVTKREVRAEVTMIVSRGNNPVKFAPDGEAATMQLLGTPFPGFMPPVDAMKDAFDDLRAHQIGVIAGSRAAFSAVLQRFDPASLETKLGVGGVLDSLMPSARRSKLWLQYTAMFEEILQQAEDDYGALFGEAFRRAYEAEVDRVISDKRGGAQ